MIITSIESKNRHVTALLTISYVGAILLIGLAASKSPAQNERRVPYFDRGKQLFDRRCGGCHSLDQDQTGPRLRTIYGRKAGSVPGFKYSAGLRSAGFIWDDAALDKWLTEPDSVIPGNEMDFSVAKPEERAAIIRFLRLSSGR